MHCGQIAICQTGMVIRPRGVMLAMEFIEVVIAVVVKAVIISAIVNQNLRFILDFCVVKVQNVNQMQLHQSQLG